jgi:hypothetical protein
VYGGTKVFLNLSNIPLVGGLVTHPKEALSKARDFWKSMPNGMQIRIPVSVFLCFVCLFVCLPVCMFGSLLVC